MQLDEREDEGGRARAVAAARQFDGDPGQTELGRVNGATGQPGMHLGNCLSLGFAPACQGVRAKDLSGREFKARHKTGEAALVVSTLRLWSNPAQALVAPVTI